jgi:acyl-coenzyme A thioesterase PaaI-like protein/HAMP domain-containing protein
LRLKDGTRNEFEAIFPKDWLTTNPVFVFPCFPWWLLLKTTSHAHGGTTASYIHVATREYFRLQYPNLNQPGAIILNIHYLNPLYGGPFTIIVHDVKIGRKISTVRVGLNATDRKGNLATCATAVVTQSNLAIENGVTGTSNINFKDGMPRREDCVRHAETWIMDLRPIIRKLWILMLPGGPDARWKDRFGLGIRESWVKMDDETVLDLMLVGHVCDLVLAIPILWPADHLEALQDSLAYGYPTISMSMEIKRDPKCAEWLFVRIKTDGLLHGRYTSDVTVLNGGGELVAVARIMRLVVEVSREKTGAKKNDVKL